MDIQQAIAGSRGTLSVGGARYSMGGQVAAPRSLHLDMRAFRAPIALDPDARRVRVQAGMSWRDLQDLIDPHDLSVRVMQSYSNFSIGGSLSVNCHGRYVGRGPVINTVRALQLVAADGTALECSRERNADIFAAAIGGYGGLGVITEVELDLDANTRIARRAEAVPLDEYPAWFRERVLSDPNHVLHNADLVPPDFDRPLAITWSRTEAPLTRTERLVPRDVDYARDQNLIWCVSELPGGARLRERFSTRALLREPAVVWRNHEASLDARSLEPRTRALSTYLLQEYFIPVPAFAQFARTLAVVLRDHDVAALNVSVRHSPADRSSLLAWASEEVLSFVLYHKQRNTASADQATGRWTRRLVDAALDCGGRYYLPYRLHASTAQFRRAYPAIDAFAALKRRIDPDNRFRNCLWDRYLPA